MIQAPTYHTMGSAVSVGDAPASRRPAGRRGHGHPCPFEDCGGTLTPVVLSGKDTKGRPLRKRRCLGCEEVFVTVEMVVPAKFSEVDDTHQRHSSASKRRKFGWQEKGSKRRVRDIYALPVVNRRTRLPEWGAEAEED